MTAVLALDRLDGNTEIGTLCYKVRGAVERFLVPLMVAIAVEVGYLSLSGKTGTGAFAMIGLGTCVALKVWSRGAIGLPLLPMFLLQGLVIYGVPIAASHDTVIAYPPDFVFDAGVEVLLLELAIILSWSAGMKLFHPSRAASHTLHEFNKSGARGWGRLGYGMIVGTTIILVMESSSLFSSLFSSLPLGIESLVNTLLAVVAACGFFLVSMLIGSGESSAWGSALFWTLLVGNAALSSVDFILSTAAGSLITAAIGFFWSSGRVPWRYLIIVLLTLSFFNTGKSTMRERYWGSEDAPSIELSLGQMPSVFAEWAQVSFDAVVENDAQITPAENIGSTVKSPNNKNQTLLDRIDNLQNLLFVIDAEKTERIPPLYGRTYSLIPPLLIPRFLWPDKPRSHEGQVLLNVHFGRQDLESTFTTYIAWGLLPEAYGNFGPVAGSLMLGVLFGALFAWVENLTARKLVMSTEGFLSLSLLMNLMNSFEMVASVFVTSTFQSFVIVVAASLPFVHRTPVRKPETDDH